MMKKFYVNHRLLKYKLNFFDYSKLSNNHYFSRKKNLLLLNYYWNISSNLEQTIKFSKKLSGPSWFKILENLNLLELIFKKYNTGDKQEIWKAVNNKRCQECDTFIDPSKTFCSNKCSNLAKTKNLNFNKNLSLKLKKFHSKQSKEQKEKIRKKISNSVKLFNNKLSKSEKSEKYSNKNLNLTAYENLQTRFPDLNLLFNKEYFYKNKFLPVSCKICSFSWEITKTTALARTECKKCYPSKKHKTQSLIYRYVNSLVSAKENVKNVISNELDIYCKKKNFAIEYNGLLPHSFGFSKISYYNNLQIDSTYHLRKTEEAESKNIQLFHIFENEFIDKNKRQIWFSVINSKLGLSEIIYARKCSVQEIHSSSAREFCSKNHLQGSCNSSIRIGLFYNKELVSVMTFRKHKKYSWEIARFCSKLNLTVTGGASKLLKFFERKYNPESIISYANRRWSRGDLYERLGFEFIQNTNPNYFYFRPNENILFSREQFQKHKLKNKLELFDPELTETQNMFNSGFRKIYDSGNKKYVKRYHI